MNIEKIYNSVNEDEMNSPLLSIVWELGQQGYAVKLEGLEVTASDLEEDMFSDLEKATNEFNIEITKENLFQKFKLVFTDYHRFNFESC